MALLFWAFAAASVGGALFVVTRRNLIAAVMGMVGSFLGIAAVYMMLYAQLPRRDPDAGLRRRDHGAVRVRHHDPEPARGRAGRTDRARRAGASAALAIVYLVGRLVMLLDPRQAAEHGRSRSPRRRRSSSLGRASRLGLGEGGRHRPVRRRPVPVRGDLDPAARRRGRRDRDRAAAPRATSARRPTLESGRTHAMNDLLFDIGYGHFLVLAAVLFLIGVGRRARSAATRSSS